MILSPTTTTSSKLSTSGNLLNLKPNHIDTFLAALDLSYSAALKFDARPSLKFLVQKVANLEKPANLYRQAAASWMIKIMTLLELSLREIERTDVDLEKVKMLMRTETKIQEKYLDLVKYLRYLRAAFDELCETYSEIVMDKDGRYTRIDGFSERKVFLLVAQPDEYAEIKDEPPPEDGIEENTGFTTDDEDHEEDIYNPNVEEELEQLGLKVEKEKDERPFRLSDLAVEYSTDSGPESEPETDDSRPASRLGSINDRIVYPDRSGCTSSEGCIDSKNSFTPEPLKSCSSEDQLASKLTARSKSTVDKRKWIKERNEFIDSERTPRKNLQRRKSDICILSLRSNRLNFLNSLHSDQENCERISKSAMELRVCDLRRSSLENGLNLNSTTRGNEFESKASDNVEALLEDYKRSKRGFRTNPFLEDEDEKMLLANQYIFSQVFEFEFQKKSVINKDSEAHRKAWAETLNATIDSLLALSVSIS